MNDIKNIREKMNLLILLIGENPIANYALIEFFKNNKDEIISNPNKVVLVCTEKTSSIAQRIKSLQSEVLFEIINLGTKENNLNYIKNEILRYLNELSPDNIHLNYTGGRKPMSIGAFVAVKEYENQGCNKIYSDICPRKYILTLEDGTTYPKEGNISFNLNIHIEDFFLLHGLSKPKYEKVNSEFYSNQFCKFLFEQNMKNEENFYINMWDKNLIDLKKLPWQETLHNFTNTNISNKKLKDLQKFIKGIWLEEYIFNFLKEKQKYFLITELAWDVKSENHDKLFQVDVIVICGYRSYIFSCTTENQSEDILKQKAFEGVKRSNQFGGIESKTILVCLAKDEKIEAIKKDMSDNYKKGNFEVIGAEILKNNEILKLKIKEIFK